MTKRWLPILMALTGTVLGLCAPAAAVKVADITRIGGQRTNVIVGMGLIVGLKGTGDGGAYLPATKYLVGMLERLSRSDPAVATNLATVKDLASANNVAIVSVMATVPRDGVRNGDHIDCTVNSIGAASSLKDGTLFVTPMRIADPRVARFVAMAQGQVVIEDPTVSTAGVIKGGAVLEADLPARYIEDDGRFWLILDDAAASWTNASTIAKVINDAEGTSGETLAVAVDPKNVSVSIPPPERERPDSFISRVQRLPVPMLATEARVVINDRTGTMIVTGDVEISPVVISHKGLTITTTNPPPVPSLRNPLVTQKTLVPLDTTNQGGAKLQDLVNALDQLKVPAEDRITIIKELYRTGKLHAKLIVE